MFRKVVEEKIRYWKLPFAGKLLNTEHTVCNIWQKKALESLPMRGVLSFSPDRASTLSTDFWKTNQTKRSTSLKSFISHAGRALQRHYTNLDSNSRNKFYSLPDDLMIVLIRSFSLHVDANSSCLTHSTRLPLWCSDDTRDQSFGSLGPFEFSGRWKKLSFCLVPA